MRREQARGAGEVAGGLLGRDTRNQAISFLPLCLQETEVVNTAILTGRRVAVPIKLVTVETDGQVREVDDSVTCSSTDVDVVKV